MIVPSRQGLSTSKTGRNSNPGRAQSMVGTRRVGFRTPAEVGAVFQILICACEESEERETALAEQWMHGTPSIP